MRTLLLALVALVPTMSSAQKSPPSTQDEFLREYAETRRYQSGRPVSLKFTPDGKTLLFLRSGPKSAVQSLFAFDTTTGKVDELLTADDVLKGAAQELTEEEKARMERMRSSARGIIGYQLSDDGKQLITPVSGKLYLVDLAKRSARQLKTGEGAPLDVKFSPDGRRIAYVRNGDLYTLDLATNRERRLTRDGSEHVTNGLPEFVAQEEMGRFEGYWWSPDSKFIAYQRNDTSAMESFAIVDPTHPEKGAHIFPYPRPGKANAEVRLGIIGVGGGNTTWVKWDAKKYPYLATARWPKKGPFTILAQNRYQTEQVLLSVDAQGRTKELLSESDPAWINLDQRFPKWLESGDGFLWYTERNGGPEVELRAKNGKKLASLVPPDAGFDELVGYDAKGGWVYFTGSKNPTESVLYRSKEGVAPERVKTDEAGPAMQLATASEDASLFAVATTTLKYMPRTAVFRADGTKVGDVPSVAIEPKLQPTTELLTVKAGQPLPFHAAIIRPRDFQKGKKYPVVLQVYGGPHHMEVRNSLREELMLQWLADQGFIVVKTDNRGTTNRRGREWERVIKHDLGGVPMDDQVAVLKALGKQLPELDLTRVGIQGWSYGGYMTSLGMLRYPDVFKVGVSGAPVVDWRDYDTHYTERYMGLPEEQKAAYDKASLLTHAKNLKGSLLLVHGTADDNVYFFHSLKLSDALFRAGKRHDLLPLSDFTHMVADPLINQRLNERMAQQLKDALLK